MPEPEEKDILAESLRRFRKTLEPVPEDRMELEVLEAFAHSLEGPPSPVCIDPGTSTSAFVKRLLAYRTDPRRRKAEQSLASLSFWIPRRHREAIIGDIREDCAELRLLGKSEWRIRLHVIWQLAICLLTMWPAALKAALWGALGALISRMLGA